MVCRNIGWKYHLSLYAFLFSGLHYATKAYSYNDVQILEEIIVTAQKREQKMQDTPVALSVLDAYQLENIGVTGLDTLADNIIPSLRVSPNGNTSSSLTIAIRGDGPSDVVQPLREAPVAIYLDNIYLGRTQGLSMELADLQRIEVLRGPQGTLFGRNASSGAVSLITRQPTGQWGIKQTIGTGSYNQFRSTTRINTPTVADIKAKLNIIYSERDGWIKNRASGQSDFNESDKQGANLHVNWEPQQSIAVDYRFDITRVKSTQNYFQLYGGNTGTIVRETSRETKTRFPLPLKPAIADISGHSLSVKWMPSDSLTIKSLTAYRELDEDGSNNYGGALRSGGIILEEDIKQEQYSQEFQLIGNYDTLEWVTGIFYFKEDTDYDLHLLFSLTPSLQPIIPPVSSLLAPPTFVTGNSESIAAFIQGTLTLTEALGLTIGTRYTADKKTAIRNNMPAPNQNSENVDSTLSLFYKWTDSLSAYIKRATGYKSGGYNVRSLSFNPYDEETNETFEAGLKSEWLNQRVRVNAAVFKSTFKNKQFDFADPIVTIAVDTLNATRDVKISGAEIDLTAIPVSNLQAGIHYVYIDGDMPPQPHPRFNGLIESFELIQTPVHSGSLTLDYIPAVTPVGQFNLHLDVTSTARYAHSTVPISSQDGYTLFNGSVTLKNGNLSLSVYGRNLTDEKYANLRFKQSATGSIIQSFGIPRTFGINVTYEL